MNALFLVSCAVLAACSSSQLINYNGFYPGFYSGYYPSLYNNFAGLAPLAYTAPKVSINTVQAPTIAAASFAAPAPLAYNFAAPVASLAAASPIQSQYHAQDELGQYSFGYAGGPSARQETRDAFGVVRGSFNYVDADGKVQTQQYVADALGYRVAATNLPVAPEAPAAALAAAPLPVQETPEVAAARAEHQKAYAEAAAAAAAAPDTDVVVSRKKRDAQFISAAAPLRFSYGFNTLNYGYPFAGFPTTYTAGLTGLPAATTYTAGFTGLPAATYTAGFPTAATYTAGFPAAAIPAVSTYNAAAAAAPRDATLLKVVHNPGHATSYRVD